MEVIRDEKGKVIFSAYSLRELTDSPKEIEMIMEGRIRDLAGCKVEIKIVRNVDRMGERKMDPGSHIKEMIQKVKERAANKPQEA